MMSRSDLLMTHKTGSSYQVYKKGNYTISRTIVHLVLGVFFFVLRGTQLLEKASTFYFDIHEFKSFWILTHHFHEVKTVSLDMECSPRKVTVYDFGDGS